MLDATLDSILCSWQTNTWRTYFWYVLRIRFKSFQIGKV